MVNKKVDVFVLILFLFFGISYSIFTKDLLIGRAVFAFAIFTLPQVAYLGIRKNKPWKKIIFATLIFGTLNGFFFEFIAEFNRSYSVISTVFPKILGIVPVDNILGHTMMTLLTFTFYEHFMSIRKSSSISSKSKYAILISLSAIIISLFMFSHNPNLLRFDYTYFYMGLAAIIPPVILGIKKPQFIKDMAVTAIYFFFLYLSLELLAVKYNWWIYKGTYIGRVTLFNYSFPFEELFFWMLFYAASLVSYYKIFIDRNNHSKKSTP